MSSGVSLFIVVLTVLNIVGAAWLLWATRKRRGEAARTTDTTGHVWDGDLREYNNPLPRWWLWFFIITMVFSVVYLILYPGLGNNPGALGWTEVRQWEQQQRVAETEAQKILSRFEGVPLEQLSRDPEAIAIGRNLFANNCAACHGADARGAVGFPNLVDRDWAWGSAPATIEQTILEGRTGVMPPWGEVLGEQGTQDTVAFVLSLSGRKADAGDVEAGRARFEEICAACHGVDGRGNTDLGAPNLTDDIWTYGGSADAIRQSIVAGRQNHMPAHGQRLGPTRVHILAAYVLSLQDAGAGPAGGNANGVVANP